MNPALVQAWKHTVGGAVPDGDLDLASCALLIAEIERPELSAPAYLGQLDALAAAVKPQEGEALLDAAVRHLFVELGFRGNAEAYYDPANSCLDQVLDRRLGIPITLSVVLLEVGWRLGLDVAGVGFPGHFLVVAGERIVDPFHGGETLTHRDLAERLPGGVALTPTHLRRVTRREILARMLNNLSGIYRKAGDRARLRDVGELLSVLSPAGPPVSSSN